MKQSREPQRTIYGAKMDFGSPKQTFEWGCCHRLPLERHELRHSLEARFLGDWGDHLRETQGWGGVTTETQRSSSP